MAEDLVKYGVHLNQDLEGIRTPAEYNEDLQKWIINNANYVMSDSGVWVPQRGSDDGAVHTQLVGDEVESREVLVRVSDEIVPAESTFYIVEHGTPISNNLKRINILLNSDIGSFDLIVRLSTGGSTGSVNRRFSATYNSNDLKSFTDTDPKLEGNSYILRDIPVIGGYLYVGLVNTSDADDASITCLVEGVK